MNSQAHHTGPTVSVNIVTYNRRRLLQRAVGSVLDQAFPNFEIVVIDDGSADGTAEMLAAIGDPRITCTALAHTGRLGRLRNLALAASRGRYIALLDSDDAWAAGKLERQVGFMTEHSLGFSATGVRSEKDEAAANAREDLCLDTTSRHGWISRLMLNWTIHPSSIMFTRVLAHALRGFREDLVSAGDAEFILRLIRSTPSGFLHAPLFVRATPPDQHSRVHAALAYREMLTIIRQCQSDGILSSHAARRASSALLYRLAGELKLQRDLHGAKEALRECLRLNPLHWRAGLRWVLP
jgi:glycosyltransferase involved in cell wall biosynthesis